MEYSLFFFADSGTPGGDGYRLLLDSARFADRNGFSAIWTPERHFHSFGGIYPNPAVTGAAVAAVTDRIDVRAGSVVAPLHHPIRIAEEWAVVDNLSRGRAGVSFASGWHATDFGLRPENYPERSEVMVEAIQTVRRLWAGETVEITDGMGQKQAVHIFPTPVQRELPTWITSAGSPDTFRTAGALGAGVLTHLLGQSPDDLTANIGVYRQALAEHGSEDSGHVVLMLHTLLGSDPDDVRDLVREPLTEYLRSSMDLVIASSDLIPPGIEPSMLAEQDREFLLQAAFERYFAASGLFGTVAQASRFAAQLESIGVDEVACLIDFGVPHEEVMDSLDHLVQLIPAPAANGSSGNIEAPGCENALLNLTVEHAAGLQGAPWQDHS